MSNFIYKNDIGEELYHHGVKGQKYGIRNYQYKDGSLTPEGRVHYGVGPARSSKVSSKSGTGLKAKNRLKYNVGTTKASRDASNDGSGLKSKNASPNYDYVGNENPHVMETYIANLLIHRPVVPTNDPGCLELDTLKKEKVRFDIPETITPEEAYQNAKKINSNFKKIHENISDYLISENPAMSYVELQRRSEIKDAHVHDDSTSIRTKTNEVYNIDTNSLEVNKRESSFKPKTKGLIQDLKARTKLSPIDYKDYKGDEKSRKKRARELAAETNTLKNYGVAEQAAREVYADANKNYQKELASSSGFLGLKAREKAERVNAAQAKLDSASKTYNQQNDNLNRIADRVQAESDNYISHVNKMINKYGNDVIKNVKMKTIKLGQNIVQTYIQAEDGGPSILNTHSKRKTMEIADPGFTIANAPVIGPKYSASVSARNDWENREANQQQAMEKKKNANTTFLNNDDRYNKKKKR